MARGRKIKLKVGDPVTLVSHKDKKGVIVSIHTDPVLVERGTVYNVHFYPTGRGTFSYDDLIRTKPNTPVLVDDPPAEVTE